LDKETEERFWSKVNIGNKNDCWEWTAGTRGKKTGYGCFKYNGKVTDSHRMSWFITHGYFPENLVCHKCDNRLCCNPNHLFEGTYSDNMKDCVKKGRHGSKKGEENPLYKPLKEHGTSNGYKKGCKCKKCLKYHSENMREWRRNRNII